MFFSGCKLRDTQQTQETALHLEYSPGGLSGQKWPPRSSCRERGTYRLSLALLSNYLHYPTPGRSRHTWLWEAVLPKDTSFSFAGFSGGNLSCSLQQQLCCLSFRSRSRRQRWGEISHDRERLLRNLDRSAEVESQDTCCSRTCILQG